MKEINTSTFDFPSIVQNDFLYVDKTAYIWNLVRPKKGEYFLARPRRFGKSLLVSTLKAFFQGRKKLFQGLAIAREKVKWQAYPVIHLDLANSRMKTAEDVEKWCLDALDNASKQLGIPLRGRSYAMQFENLIRDAADGSRRKEAVVLIDEYDKPILSNITNPQAEEVRDALKDFYSCVKKCEGVIRFALVTGVSKFAHVSLFSELNNLTDITLHPDYAAMLGFTAAEIREYFADRIPLAAEANGMSPEALTERLLEWYDGYRFSPAETHVCNPVSVSKFFTNCYAFSNYWEDTGTPSFLLELARRQSYDYEAALEQYYDESVFKSYELDRLDVTGLLWQTGYLTIKEVRRDGDELLYRLGFPDREVQATFSRRLIEFFAAPARQDEAWGVVRQLRTAIRQDDLAGFMTHFQAFLACIPYEMHLKYEKYYQTIFYCVFKLLGASIEAESRTNAGRIDAYIKTARTVYIFEFKLNQTPETAVGQILDRRYYERFQDGGQPIVLVGAIFDSSKGRLVNWAETTMSSSTLISEDVLH
jgi:hypothetical protein